MANLTAVRPFSEGEVWAGRATLPPQVTARLLSDIDVVARRMTRRIAMEISLPAQFRSIGYLRSVTSACRDALRTLVRLLRDGRGLRSADLQRLGSMGAQQAETGVPLEVLLSAYRLAARVVWQEVIGQAAGLELLPQATVIAVTGQVLEYLDEISAAVGAAYLETRERLMRRRDRERDRILQRLVAGDASPELRRLAAATDLDLQPPYRVLAVSLADDDGERALDRAWRPRGVLLVADEPRIWIALLPARIDARRLLDTAEVELGEVQRLRCAMGPVAPTLEDVAQASRRAVEALRVGVRLDPGTRDHDEAALGIFATLLQNPASMARFVEHVLGPVLTGPPLRGASMLETLEAMLMQPSLNDAAAALRLHRHTVVYRVRRLEDLGISVASPQQRYRLWLALQCHRLLAT